MKLLNQAALLIAALAMTCVPAASQNVAKLPAAATLTGAEKLPAVQGTGCATNVAPCATVAVTPSQLAAYVAGAAWTQYTPALGCGSGSLTTASALGRYKQIGKTVSIQITIKVPANGSCAAILFATLPSVAFDNGQGSSWVLIGREDGTSGKVLQGLISPNANTVIVRDFTNGYPAASGSVINLTGIYESN